MVKEHVYYELHDLGDNGSIRLVLVPSSVELHNTRTSTNKNGC